MPQLKLCHSCRFSVTPADFTFSFRDPEASHWGTAALWSSAKSISNLSKDKEKYVFPIWSADGNNKLIQEKKCVFDEDKPRVQTGKGVYVCDLTIVFHSFSQNIQLRLFCFFILVG